MGRKRKVPAGVELKEWHDSFDETSDDEKCSLLPSFASSTRAILRQDLSPTPSAPSTDYSSPENQGNCHGHSRKYCKYDQGLPPNSSTSDIEGVVHDTDDEDQASDGDLEGLVHDTDDGVLEGLVHDPTCTDQASDEDLEGLVHSTDGEDQASDGDLEGVVDDTDDEDAALYADVEEAALLTELYPDSVQDDDDDPMVYSDPGSIPNLDDTDDLSLIHI